MSDSWRSDVVISTILKHDRKVTSYKIALIRAINDVALSFPDLTETRQDVAIPLWMLAEWWIAYYWPFVALEAPISQGPQPQSGSKLANDMAFRPTLTTLRRAWEIASGSTSPPSEGFFVRSELRIPRRQSLYSPTILTAYGDALKDISKTLQMPIRYAGPAGEQWSIFPKPCRFAEIEEHAVAVPGTQPSDMCLLVTADLWRSFCRMAHWIEALCIHEWCLFTESLRPDSHYDRGSIFRLITTRPENRRPMTWERHQIDLLLMEGVEFTCPWTEIPIRQSSDYDVDHLIPIAIYPTNELWNLIPSNPTFNQSIKRDRLPSTVALERARPQIIAAYRRYDDTKLLHRAFHEDVALRFSPSATSAGRFPDIVAASVINFVEQIALARNSTRF